MKNRNCYLFVFDGFADWEPALVTSGLNNYSDFAIKTFSVDGGLIRSMGNLAVKPDMRLEELKLDDIDLLILPGGARWDEGGNTEIADLIRPLHLKGKVIAAICAATTMIAKADLVNEVKHTSNGLEYLKQQVPDYNAENNYVNVPCVRDKNVITANGAAMIEFACQIFEHFELFDN